MDKYIALPRGICTLISPDTKTLGIPQGHSALVLKESRVGSTEVDLTSTPEYPTLFKASEGQHQPPSMEFKILNWESRRVGVTDGVLHFHIIHWSSILWFLLWLIQPLIQVVEEANICWHRRRLSTERKEQGFGKCRWSFQSCPPATLHNADLARF